MNRQRIDRKGKMKMKRVKCAYRYAAAVFFAAVLFCMTAFAAFAAEEITRDGYGTKLPISEQTLDGEVRLYTYTIYDASGQQAGTVELRYGTETSHYGIRLWITAEGEPVEITNNSFYVRTTGLTIDDTTWCAYFTGDTFTCDVAETVLSSIPAPTSVVWDRSQKPGVITWTEVEQADGRYLIRVLHDGRQEHGISTSNSSGRMDLADDINESGSYVVTVKAIGGKTTGDSAEIESAAYVYEMPEEKLGISTKVWWTAKEGETLPTVINWNPVPGAGGYDITLVPSEGTTRYGRTVYNTGNNLATSEDWAYRIKSLNTEAGKPLSYTVTVRALAGNIEVVANANENEVAISDAYDTSDVMEEIKDDLSAATAEDVLDVIAQTGIDTVAAAMQTDKEVLEQMDELEKQYAAANKIQVEAPEVTHPALNAEKISVVGAGINAVTGGSVHLNFSKVAAGEEKNINEKLYQNAVQVSITLDSKDAQQEEIVTGSLKCPIAITMLPPSGIDLDKLVILHYHADGTYEYIYPANNADGTITFSVTSFSTFVFAEIVTYTNGDDAENNNSGNNGNGNDGNDEDSYFYEKEESTSSNTAGLTGVGSSKKYRKADGSYAKKEWVKVGNTWYYAGADGVLLTGWYQNADGVWYFMDAECRMLTGWQMVDGKWYYLDAVNGDMKTGWLQDADGKWYFLNQNGDMKTGWLMTADGKWYYLGSDGACLMDTTTPDGYQVNADGAWIPQT